MQGRDESKKRYDALLEEYKSLREEVMKKQDARLYIAGFTVAAIGTILGFTLGSDMPIEHKPDHYLVGLVSFALIVLNTALVLTLQHTMGIDSISAYIRKFIEPEMPGLGWETRLQRYRKLARSKGRSLPIFATLASKSLSLFYASLTIGIYSVVFVRSLYHPFSVILISILAMCSFALCYIFYKGKTKSWRVDWDIIGKQD